MIYQNLSAYYDHFVDDKLNNIYVKLVKKYKEEGNLIDLGTGTGQLAIMLAKEGYNVTGTDLVQEMLEIAYSNSVEEDIYIKFYIHDILDPLNTFYDIITMTSDVINYLDDKEKVSKAFANISNAMHSESILLFDFLTIKHIEKMDGHKEDLLMHDDLIEWSVSKTIIPNQMKHQVKISGNIETHIQTTFKPSEYIELLQENDMRVVEKIKYNERHIFVCKKK